MTNECCEASVVQSRSQTTGPGLQTGDTAEKRRKGARHAFAVLGIGMRCVRGRQGNGTDAALRGSSRREHGSRCRRPRQNALRTTAAAGHGVDGAACTVRATKTRTTRCRRPSGDFPSSLARRSPTQLIAQLCMDTESKPHRGQRGKSVHSVASDAALALDGRGLAGGVLGLGRLVDERAAGLGVRPLARVSLSREAS